MPKRIPPLTELQIRNAKPQTKEVKLFDGGGLFLSVSPSGGKLWRLKYRFGGHEKKLSMGAFPAVSLSAARQKREDAKELIAQGIDPSEWKKNENLASITFKDLALDWLALQENAWTPGHRETVEARLSVYKT